MLTMGFGAVKFKYKMCYKGKILNFIPVKPACFVLAIINAIVNGIILMYYVLIWGILIMLIGLFSGVGGRYKRDLSDDVGDLYVMTAVLSFLALPLVFLLDFIFSAILCNGINNLKPRQVKTYFWYGVGANIITFIVALILLSVRSTPGVPLPLNPSKMGVVLLVKCAYRSLFLILVHHTHKRVVQEAALVDHVPLVEVIERNTVEV